MSFIDDIQKGMQLPQSVMQSYYTPQMNQLAMLQQQAKLDQLKGLDPVSQQNIKASQANVDLAQKQDQRANNKFTLEAVGALAGSVLPYLEKGDQEGANEMFKAIEYLTGNPIPEEMRSLEAVKGIYEARSGATTELKTFNEMTKGLSEEDKKRAKRIELGLDPRAVGSSSITIAETGKTEQVAKSQAVIEGLKAGEKETAKLNAQKKLKPAVEAAVKEAVSIATAQAEINKEDRGKASALKLYDTAMSGLVGTFENTNTGPFTGWLPALTSNQQITDAAIAAMAPVLKEIFRQAGEGSFSDGDRAALMAMIPDRTFKQEAIVSAIKNIDTIVRARLTSQENNQPEDTVTLPNGVTVNRVK